MSNIEKVHNYILFIKAEVDVHVIVTNMMTLRSWNPHALFLVIIDRLVSFNWEYIVNYITIIFTKYLIINTTIYIPSNTTSQNDRVRKKVYP